MPDSPACCLILGAEHRDRGPNSGCRDVGVERTAANGRSIVDATRSHVAVSRRETNRPAPPRGPTRDSIAAFRLAQLGARHRRRNWIRTGIESITKQERAVL